MSVKSSTSVKATYSTSTKSHSTNRSGVTESEYISAKVQPYLDQIDQIETKISKNKAKISAYQMMQSYLQILETYSNYLRGSTDSSSDVFKQRTTSLTSSSSTAASSVLSASIDSATATGSHTVVVDQLATSERIASSTISSSSSALGLSGVFTLSESGKTAMSVTVDSTMSLSDISDAINNRTSTTGVTATIITIASGSSYELVLTSADTGQTISLSSSTYSGTSASGSLSVLDSLGLTNGDGSTISTELQKAQDAIVEVDGVSGIVRSSNDISDILSGVTLHLTDADTGTTVTMDITYDTSTIETAIDAFVNAYNAWRGFYSSNQATNSDGAASSTAVLFGDSTLRNAQLDIDDAITSYIGDSGLSAIGISFDSDNYLQVDTTTLENALTDEFSTVMSLFEYTSSTSNSDLNMTSHGTATYSGTFSLSIATNSDGSLASATATDADGNTVSFSVSGNTLKGTGEFSSLTFYYTGKIDATVSVTTSQGIADQTYQTSKLYSDTTSGTIETVISNLQSQDTQLESRASQIQAMVDSYSSFLLTQYADAESSISSSYMTASILQTLMSYDTS
jgi:flagellar hook-associated protein 2